MSGRIRRYLPGFLVHSGGGSAGLANIFWNGQMMGLLAWLKRRFGKPNPANVGQVAYAMAYYVLPDYSLNHRERLVQMCKELRVAKIFYYVMACQFLKMQPVPEQAEGFQWHSGRLADGRDYLVMEFPWPPELRVDADALAEAPPEKWAELMGEQTLAPYFSGVAYNDQGEARYLVLAQSLLKDRFTLRECLPNGSHGSLGDGPSPTLDNFLACFSEERELQTLFSPGV